MTASTTDPGAPTTVADLVIADPKAAEVFERYGIDYCCNGRRSLSGACVAAGVPEADVRRELDARPAATAAPAAAPAIVPAEDIGALIGHIVTTHHTYLRRELPRLTELMDKVVAAHAEAHPDVLDVARLVGDIADDLLPHIVKEERALFPMTIELMGAVTRPVPSRGSIVFPVEAMNHEHEQTGAMLTSLRRLTHGYSPPEDACPTWRALYTGLADLEIDVHTHIHLENNVLFPMILELEQRIPIAD